MKTEKELVDRYKEIIKLLKTVKSRTAERHNLISEFKTLQWVLFE